MIFGGVIGFFIIYQGLNIQGHLLRKVGCEAITNQQFESIGFPSGGKHGAE